MPNFTLFTTGNGRGLSFEVQESCIAANNPVMCGVEFDDNNAATKFGPYKRGDFQGDPDIAGIGIIIALLFQTFFLWILAVIHTIWFRNKSSIKRSLGLDDRFLDYLFSISDFMTLVAVAYEINFVLNGKCVMSTYHYYVVLDSILIACSSIVITFLVSGSYNWGTVAGFVRAGVSLLIFISMWTLIGYQLKRHPPFPEWSPPNVSRNDSALLLPASCFFDPDLIRFENPYSPELPQKLTPAQMARVGEPWSTWQLPEIWLFFFIFFFFGYALVASCCCCSRARKHQQPPPKEGLRTRVSRLLPLLVPLVTNIICTWHILSLRTWVRRSNWMAVDASKITNEESVAITGQIIPLATVVFILVQPLGYLKTCRQPRKERNHV